MAERGPGVSLREIAADAGVNHGLVYLYVGTKDDLIREVYRQAAESAAIRFRDTADLQHALQLLMSLGDGTTARLIGWAALNGEQGPEAFRDSPALDVLARLATTAAEDTGEPMPSEDARVFAALAMAVAIGWRLFGETSLYAAGLDGSHPERYEQRIMAYIDQLPSHLGGPLRESPTDELTT